MGLDMYMYNSKYTDIKFEEDDDRCLYWRGQRQLHELFYMFGKRTEKEGYFIFTKDDVIRMVAYLMESVMNIHKAAKVAYDDMMDAEEKELRKMAIEIAKKKKTAYNTITWQDEFSLRLLGMNFAVVTLSML